MMNSTIFGTNGLNLSTNSIIDQVTDKKYRSTKKSNNGFNITLGTKVYLSISYQTMEISKN